MSRYATIVPFFIKIVTLFSHPGDSGGPLTIAGYLAGVVSYGVQNCELGYPSVYTNIFPYHLWIDNNLKWANGGNWF